MHITHLYLNGVGPLTHSHLDLRDDWRGGAHSQVLLTGPNGCGKSTVLRAIAMLWEAAGWWLEHRKHLPAKHVTSVWLQRWQGVAVIVNKLEPFTTEPVGLVFGAASWVDELLKNILTCNGWASHSNTRTARRLLNAVCCYPKCTGSIS